LYAADDAAGSHSRDAEINDLLGGTVRCSRGHAMRVIMFVAAKLEARKEPRCG
jgi:hypothetical protein